MASKKIRRKEKIDFLQDFRDRGLSLR
uniref:Uncharacterized protein n=1 Tax=Arundo donax TaxID=35708 RepID=A0A0A9GDL2_ARUDO